jgi:hypothetical protein
MSFLSGKSQDGASWGDMGQNRVVLWGEIYRLNINIGAILHLDKYLYLHIIEI